MSRALASQSLDARLADGSRTTLDLIARPIGEGADATVHAIQGQPDFVAKLYRAPDAERRAKLEAMLAAPPCRTVSAHEGGRVVALAWPEVVLTAPGRDDLAGFVMPSVDLSAAVLLDALLSPRGRDAVGLTHAVRFRLAAAANLAAAVTELHALGHHVIDLKPSNLHVYRQSALVAVLDCDGMSVCGPDDARFPAHQYTDGYIAPEALRDRARPEGLGEPQDRFALAVVLFQLLNNGLHPFQGVPNRSARNVPTTNGERIAAGLYPYGRGGHTLAPPPASPFPFLDTQTQTLFGRAFDGAAEGRPSAEEWRDHLRAVLADDLAPCPENADHARFASKLCAGCELDPAVQKRRRRAAFAARRTKGEIPLPAWLHRLGRDARAYVSSPGFGGVAVLMMGVVALGLLATAVPDPSATGDTVADAIALRDPALLARVLDRDPDALVLPTYPSSTVPYLDLYSANTEWTSGLADRAGTTAYPPLHQVAYQARPALVDLLGRAGDIDLRDGDLRTALMYAATETLSPIALRAPAADVLFARSNALLTDAEGRPDRLESVDIGTSITYGSTKGYREASRERMENAYRRYVTVHQLARLGADLNARDAWERTALHYAAASGNGPVVDLLVRLGADPGAADVAGITPLMIVADQARDTVTDAFAAELTGTLLRGGAAPARTDRSGRTAADYVGSPAIADALKASRTLAILLAASAASAVDALPATPVDATRAADIGDADTDYSTPDSDRIAALFSPVPWSQDEPVRVACSDVSSARVEATLQLALTKDYGVARRVSLTAPAWVGTVAGSAHELASAPDLRRELQREVRARERCLAHAAMELPSRFDVREWTTLSGPVTIVVQGRVD